MFKYKCLKKLYKNVLKNTRCSKGNKKTPIYNFNLKK